MPGKKTNFAWPIAIGLIVASTTGCVRQSSIDGAEVFVYEAWAPTTVLVLGLIGLVAGILVGRRWKWIGWPLAIAGTIVAALFAPSLYRDKVVVGDEGFRIRTGIWSLTAVHNVPFADVRQIRIIKTVSYTGRWQNIKQLRYYFVCELRDGRDAHAPMNSELTQAASALILDRAAARGIPIRDETHAP